jgi:DNA-binding response OmpR family regulator
LQGSLYDPAGMPSSTVSPTVLVVDEDPVILKLVDVSFEMEDFSVLTARAGEEGVAVARQHRPDAVVSDIKMPRRSGLDLVEDLKGLPAMADIPVLLLTAKAQNADVQAGLDDYITKPFDPLDLVERVNRARPRAKSTATFPSSRPS